MIPRRGFVLLICIVFLLFTGCVDVDIELTVNKDGSGEVMYRIAMDSFMYALIKESDSDPFADIKQEAEDEGFLVSSFRGDKTGIEARKEIDSIGDEVSGLNLMGDDFGMDHLIITKGFLKNHYVLDTKLDLTGFDTGPANGVEQFFGQDMFSAMRFDFTLNLPIEPTRHNASSTEHDGKTLIWNLTPGGTNTIYMEAEVWNIQTIAILTVLLFLLLAVLVGFLITKKKQQN